MNVQLPHTPKPTGAIGNTFYYDCGHATVTDDGMVLSLNGHTVVLFGITDEPTVAMQKFADFLTDVTE